MVSEQVYKRVDRPYIRLTFALMLCRHCKINLVVFWLLWFPTIGEKPIRVFSSFHDVGASEAA